ncbi:MAG: 50S ribosomal protein L19 [Bacilli bacterium]|nr:50S ribosomal protein L19 [Bacilli bacterium]
MNLVREVTESQIRKDIPAIETGDTVKVHVRIVEGNKERVQVFQGLVIAQKGSGVSKTVTVRKMSGNVGVERIFAINSPMLAKVEVLKHGITRRNKLYYVRGLNGKAAKIKERK